MSDRLQLRALLPLVFSLAAISLTGSLVFFLATPPASFVLFLIFLCLAVALTVTTLGRASFAEIKLNLGTSQLRILPVLASIILIVLQLTKNDIESINAILYVTVFVFGFGFSILSILKLNPSSSRIEYVSLAYSLSLASLAVLGTILLILPSYMRGISATMVIALLSILSFSITGKKKRDDDQVHHPVMQKGGGFILVITVIIFAFFFAELYPQISRLLGLDIARNFLYASSLTKDALSNSLYPLFGIYQSFIIYIVGQSLETFQIIGVSLNIFAILTFYAMAGQYLKRFGNHTPAIATLIWGTFAGFGWLSFLANRTDNPAMSMLSLIRQVDAFSYGDVTWRRLFFYLSLEATLTLVFAVFYFLKRNDLSKTQQIFLMTLLITPIPLMHPYGTYLLLPLLVCFAIVCAKELGKQLKYTSYSLIMASFTSLALNYILGTKIQNITINFVTFSEYLLIGLTLNAIIYLHGRTWNLNAIMSKVLNTKLPLLIVILSLVFYLASLLAWSTGSLTFNFANLNIFGYVPWFLYPVKLGIMGVLAIVAMYVLLTSSKYRSRELVAFLVSALLMIFASGAISTTQMQYASEFTFDPGSWFSEIIRQNILSFRAERMFELFKVPLAILASIVLGGTVLKGKSLQNIKPSKFFAVSGLISLILISGLASTILGFEYWHEITQTNQLNPVELGTINNLRNMVLEDGRSIIISPKLLGYLDLTGATEIITEAPAAWTSTSPEFPLFVTRYSRTTPTYVYLHMNGDYQEVSSAEEYLAHISNSARTYLENQEVRIKTINNVSIPVPQSSTTLVIPYDESTTTISQPFSQEAYERYRVLTLFFEDYKRFMNFYNEPISYNNVEMNQTAIFSGTYSYVRINGTDTNFNKISVEFEYQPLNVTLNQVIVSKFDWGTPPRKSWEIAQYGRKIALKISPDGIAEEALITDEILALNTRYIVRTEYDGTTMAIFVNNKKIASKSYQGGIFQSSTDLTIGAELCNNKPTGFAKMVLEYVRVLNDIPATAEPVYYAYDLLSALGLNYTTTLSTDNTRGSHVTQILPYDDITTNEALIELENQQTTNTHYVVILNTNGYGPLLNLFGNATSESFKADGIFTNEYSTMRFSAEVPVIIPNDRTEVKATYTNDSLSSPMIMITTQKQFTLIYVNLYPLIPQNQLLNHSLIQVLEEVLHNPMETYDEATVSPWFREPSMLFRGFKADGTIQVTSDAVASIKLQENSTISANSETGYDGSTLSMERYHKIKISSTKLTLQKGYGFYASLIAYNPSVTLEGSQTAKIDITGYATFLLRQPEINVNGKIQFENFYMLHPPTIYTDGGNTTLSGNIVLNIYVSDDATIVLPYKFNSPITVKYEKPLMEFDETGSISLMAPYLIFAGILFAMVLIIKNFKETDREENPNEEESQNI